MFNTTRVESQLDRERWKSQRLSEREGYLHIIPASHLVQTSAAGVEMTSLQSTSQSTWRPTETDGARKHSHATGTVRDTILTVVDGATSEIGIWTKIWERQDATDKVLVGKRYNVGSSSQFRSSQFAVRSWQLAAGGPHWLLSCREEWEMGNGEWGFTMTQHR